jgi:VWFA-related protein
MLLLAGLAVLVSVFVLAAIGQQAPANPVDVNAVTVLATVRDKHGNIIDSLSQNDFILDEDGRPQSIRYFSRETDLPLTLGLLFDTTSSQRQLLDQERSASGHFIDQVLREDDQDKAFLIHFDHQVELLQDLTPSKQKLNDALDLLQQSQFRRNEDDPSSSGEGYPRNSGRSLLGGTLLYDSVYLASNELMLKRQGHKAIVVLSDGVDFGSKVTLERAIESAQRANTVVYSILLPSMQGSGNSGGWGRGPGGMGGPTGGPMGRRGPGYPPRSPQPQKGRPDGKKILDRISKETGGRMFDVSKESSRKETLKETVYQIYQRINQDIRHRYSLVYVPDRPGSASEYHKIHVTTTRKDLVVQTRDGYYPAKQFDAKQEKGRN